MAIDFPASPTPGQVFQGYYWDNDKQAWRSETPSVGAVVTSTTTPTGAKNGDLWYNTNDGTLYVYFDNGITAYWTEIKANSALTTTLNATKANLAGGNTFTGTQVINSGYVRMPLQPAFSVTVDGGSNATTGNKVIFNNVLLNTGSCWSSANNRFTAPTPGNYSFTYSVLNSAASALYVEFRKNGTAMGTSAYARGYTSTQYTPNVGTCILYLDANEYIEMWVTTGTAHAYHTSFSGYLVG